MYTYCIYSMMARIRKWGNSLGLRIPKALAEEARVGDGSAVDLRVQGGRLVATPVRYGLEALLERITPENAHGEEDAGPPRGRERL